MLVPLSGDEGDRRYGPITSFTQRATLRLSTSFVRQLGVFPPQPGQLHPLVLAQRAIALTEVLAELPACSPIATP